jgi:hypothetical protein
MAGIRERPRAMREKQIVNSERIASIRLLSLNVRKKPSEKARNYAILRLVTVSRKGAGSNAELGVRNAELRPQNVAISGISRKRGGHEMRVFAAICAYLRIIAHHFNNFIL